MPASGLLSSCATPETSCPIADIFSDWISCSCSIFWSVTSRITHSTSSSSWRGVGDLDGADLAVLAVEVRFEQARLPGERLLEVGQRLGQLVVGEQWGEPLAEQLLAAVPGDDLGGVVEGREAPVGVEGGDRVR